MAKVTQVSRADQVFVPKPKTVTVQFNWDELLVVFGLVAQSSGNEACNAVNKQAGSTGKRVSSDVQLTIDETTDALFSIYNSLKPVWKGETNG